MVRVRAKSSSIPEPSPIRSQTAEDTLLRPRGSFTNVTARPEQLCDIFLIQHIPFEVLFPLVNPGRPLTEVAGCCPRKYIGSLPVHDASKFVSLRPPMDSPKTFSLTVPISIVDFSSLNGRNTIQLFQYSHGRGRAAPAAKRTRRDQNYKTIIIK